MEVLNGKLIGTQSIKSASMNEGKLCIKGCKVHEFVHSGARLTSPLIKNEGAFRKASWDEALTLVADKLSSIREQHGPNAFGFLSFLRATNEENYLVQKIARMAIGTNNVDHYARL